jgi:hypothetical protein
VAVVIALALGSQLVGAVYFECWYPWMCGLF